MLHLEMELLVTSVWQWADKIHCRREEDMMHNAQVAQDVGPERLTKKINGLYDKFDMKRKWMEERVEDLWWKEGINCRSWSWGIERGSECFDGSYKIKLKMWKNVGNTDTLHMYYNIQIHKMPP